MLRVRDWEKHFENNRTRELKSLSWVPFPNSHDGDGYTELLDHENGAAHFGAWVAIVQVASKCDMRGTLLRDGARPHDARSLARMTRIPLPLMVEALERLVNEIRWLEAVPDPEPAKVVKCPPQEGAAQPQATDATVRESAISSLPFSSLPFPSIPEEKTQEKASSAKSAKKGFAAPTVAEVQEFCAAHGIAIDAGAFHDHFAARSWIPKGYNRQMSDWHAAVRTWERNEKKFGVVKAAAGVPSNESVEDRVQRLSRKREAELVEEAEFELCAT